MLNLTDLRKTKAIGSSLTHTHTHTDTHIHIHNLYEASFLCCGFHARHRAAFSASYLRGEVIVFRIHLFKS